MRQKGNRTAQGKADAASHAAPRPRRRRWRTWLARLALVILAPVVFFAVLELGLRLCGYGFKTSFLIPTRQSGVYVTNPDFGRRFFPPTLVREPIAFRLTSTKPAETYRILVLGESAAAGIPDPPFNFGRLLQAMLREQYPTARFEVANAAMTAINSHVIVSIAQDCAAFQPDLVIVYMGNNEVVGPFGPGTVFGGFSPDLRAIRSSIWLKSWRSGQLLANIMQRLRERKKEDSPKTWGGMGMFVQNQVAADDPRLEAVYRHFEKNLRDICSTARNAGAQVLVCTVASNLKDCAPFASLHRASLLADDKRTWEDLYARANALADQGKPAEAIELYQQALRLDDRFAELHFHLGQCLLALGQTTQARERFELARDLDTLRFRTDSRQNAIIRQVAGGGEAEGTYLLDIEKALAQDGIPGREQFFEHVHYRFEGNYLLARNVFEHLRRVLPEAIRRQDKDPAGAAVVPSLQQCAARVGLTDLSRRHQAQTILGMIGKPPFTNRFDSSRQREAMRREIGALDQRLTPDALGNAAELLMQAIRQDPQDVQLPLLLGSVQIWRGRADLAIPELQRVRQELPEENEALDRLARAYMQQRRYAEAEQTLRTLAGQGQVAMQTRMNNVNVLAAQEKIDEALAQLDLLEQENGEQAMAHRQRGQLLVRKGVTPQAEAEFRRALEMAPEDPRPHLDLGRLLLARGEAAQAAAEFQAALKGEGNPLEAPQQLEARQSLVRLAAARGDFAQVVEHCRAVLALDPRAPRVRYLLHTALLRQGRTAEAILVLREEVAANPTSPAAQLALAWVLATHPEAPHRNGAEAVSLAEQALRGQQSPTADDLDTLAAAYAEAGRFADAIATAEKAAQLARGAGAADLAGRIEARLRLYQTQQPYREAGEAPPANPPTPR